jgi:hypothetical protein
MSEQKWQPARLIPAHGVVNVPEDELEILNRKVIRVREVPFSVLPLYMQRHRRERGCDGTRNFLLNPEDFPGPDTFCCEHEILTD